MNKTCLMKLGWAICSGEEALWIDVMRGKYGRDHPNFECVIAKSQDFVCGKTWLLFGIVLICMNFGALEMGAQFMLGKTNGFTKGSRLRSLAL